MEGYLLVDKPAGWTSFDAVKYIRSIISKATGLPVKKIKVGHSGTLDPFATGLLILLVGKKYTTKAESLLKQDKSYDVVLELGKTSTTGDPEGDITISKTSKQPSIEQIKAVLMAFTGEIEQTPPIYSAIRIGGVRAYKLARENKTVSIEPRKVKIYAIDVQTYEYPYLKFRVKVSSGTYIRSLVSDIGNRLGTGAYTNELRRISIGNYSILSAHTIDQINEQNLRGMLNKSI